MWHKSKGVDAKRQLPYPRGKYSHYVCVCVAYRAGDPRRLYVKSDFGGKWSELTTSRLGHMFRF